MVIRGGGKLALLAAIGLSLAGCGSAHIKRTDMGYAAYYEGDLDQAQVDFESALKKAGGFEPALTGLGLVALERGDFAQAKKYFDQAVAAERTADALYGRGVALLGLFQWKDAQADLAAAAGAQLDEANLELAIAEMLTGNGPAALKALKSYSMVSAASTERRLIAVQTAYRVGVKFDIATKAIAIVDGYEFERDSRAYHEHLRISINLAVLAADYSSAMRLARKASPDLNFGFSFRDLSPVAARRFEGLGGAVVDFVHIGSPAERAGLQAGDVLTGFRAFPVESAGQLAEAIEGFEAQAQQQKVALFEVLRDDTYYAAYMKMGDFRFDERIREIRDGGQSVNKSVATDDMAMWP